jgi:hypothetical protein
MRKLQSEGFPAKSQSIYEPIPATRSIIFSFNSFLVFCYEIDNNSVCDSNEFLYNLDMVKISVLKPSIEIQVIVGCDSLFRTLLADHLI